MSFTRPAVKWLPAGFLREITNMGKTGETEQLRSIDREIQLLVHTAALLQWDQETGMPSEAIGERSEQIALLEGFVHDRLAGRELSGLIREKLARYGVERAGQLRVDEEVCDENDPGCEEKALLRVLGRANERAVKIPRRLVTEMAQTFSRAQAAWIEAREKDDFSHFQPHLERIVSLVREKAEALGYSEQIYDALLDEFEPGMLTRQVKPVFDILQQKLAALTSRILEIQKADDHFRYRDYSRDKQREFGLKVLRDMGYEFERGRLDISAHPFTTSLGGSDIRITTHYKTDDLINALFGTIHEGGHALYELGIDPRYHQSSLGEGTSLGIHESQSRTWENIIGRSPSLWKHYFPILKDEYFPENLSDVSLTDFIRGINKVEPSLIRINADEVTYSLHIILRFNLELALVNGDLQVEGLPEAWNEGMKELLGIVPPGNADGILQDVHWSMGAIGYFPTYALGNLYGAQFFQSLRSAIPDVYERMAEGHLQPIREWQREHIHRHGSVYTAEELCRRVCGEDLNPDAFILYLEDKFKKLYDM